MSKPLFLWLLGISAVISTMVAIHTWRRRTAPGAIFLFALIVSNIIFAGTGLAIHLTKNEAMRIFWFNFLHVGALLGTPPFIFFSFQHTGRGHWLTRRNMILLSIVPVAGVLAAWTNPLHGAFYETLNIAPASYEDWTILPGWAYKLYLLMYAYPIIFYCLGIIGQSFFRSPPLYRGQSGAIFVGVLFPMIGNVVYNAIYAKEGKALVDPTPILATIQSLLFAYGIFSFRLFDISRVARHTLIESMTDGVIAIDSDNRIIDINPSAIRLLGLTHPSLIGLPLNELPFPIPDISMQEIEIKTQGESPRYFNLRVENLQENRMGKPGRLILIRDITEKKLADEALSDANKKLKNQIAKIEQLQADLRELALRDPLTGLYNRRQLEAVLKHEIRRVEENRQTLCILMVEIDGFKRINDTFGHSCGDFILQKIAEFVQSAARIADTAVRYGGDEFILVMPETTTDAAMQIAERIRIDVAEMAAQFQNQTLPPVTVSIGVASFSETGRTSDQFLHAADKAMYQAKRNGKNRVINVASIGVN